MIEYPGRLAIQQRVLPSYRVAFFDELARRCRGGLALFSGSPLEAETIPSGAVPQIAAHVTGRNMHLFHPGHPLYLCRQPQLMDWLKRIDPEVLIVEANPRYWTTFGAIAWMQTRRRPVLGWGLGVEKSNGFRTGLREAARARLLKALDGIIAYSSRGAEEYRATGFFPQDRIFTGYNAVAPSPGYPPAAPGSRPGKLIVLFAGRLQSRKRVNVLLSVCAALPENLQPLIRIVGDGPARDGLERQAADLSIQIEFMGHLEGEALAAAFRGADLFVLPGTGGLAVQEAMSYGLPVIVAEGDGTQEDLVRPENGWLVPALDNHALRTALEAALSDPSGLGRKGAESRRITVEEINIERMADRFVEAVLAVS
ncbi:MAG TPA: glycosyltransferase [Anaerolineales bacterium]|nr:glycosyltransferase [Anaerolineales bacterium]